MSPKLLALKDFARLAPVTLGCLWMAWMLLSLPGIIGYIGAFLCTLCALILATFALGSLMTWYDYHTNTNQK
jgi:hypothetical protein